MLFKILKGDSSRISTDVTPFHEGYAYVTANDGGFYIDMNNGTADERIRINPTATQVTMKKWTSADFLVMPVKGDLITLNLDGSDRQYRVLKIVDGTTVEVLGMWNLSTSTAFDSGGTNTYSGKTLDTYLNTTWYNTLSITAKNAIVPKNINQYGYSEGSYNESTHSSYADYSTKFLKANVGNRYVYALDVEDIEMYFGGTGGSASDKTAGTFSTADIWTLYWGTTSRPSTQASLWLRSSSPKGSNIANYAWCVRGYSGNIMQTYVDADTPNRVALQIDLSKIPFTIGG